jgi:hypothetical protein
VQGLECCVCVAVLPASTGMASVALVLSILVPSVGNWWYLLTLLSPAAWFYYFQKGERVEQVRAHRQAAPCHNLFCCCCSRSTKQEQTCRTVTATSLAHCCGASIEGSQTGSSADLVSAAAAVAHVHSRNYVMKACPDSAPRTFFGTFCLLMRMPWPAHEPTCDQRNSCRFLPAAIALAVVARRIC